LSLVNNGDFARIRRRNRAWHEQGRFHFKPKIHDLTRIEEINCAAGARIHCIFESPYDFTCGRDLALRSWVLPQRGREGPMHGFWPNAGGATLKDWPIVFAIVGSAKKGGSGQLFCVWVDFLLVRSLLKMVVVIF